MQIKGPAMNHVERRLRLTSTRRAWWFVIAVALVIGFQNSSLASLTAPAKGAASERVIETKDHEIESDVVIVIREKVFHVIKGGARGGDQPFFLMEAGSDHMITIRNEDNLAHGFVSPHFQNIDVHFSGDATMVFAEGASGFRIGPGKSATIRFLAPELPEGKSIVEELFWCHLHVKNPRTNKGNEIVLTRTVKELEQTGEQTISHD